MNLARHASVLWRFRAVTIGGVTIGLVLAVLASYQVGPGGLKSRGTEVWTANSQILVTQAGFPEGRVTLPTTQVGDAVTDTGGKVTEQGAKPSDQVEFADPGRLAALGDLYSKFLTSDEVLRRVPEHPPAAAVVASPFASSQGGQVLPVIQLTTMGPTAALAHSTNVHTYKALVDVIAERANANGIPQGRRIELKLLVAPAASLTSKPKPTASVLVLLLFGLGTLALTHLLEALRNRRQAQALNTIVDWEAPSSHLVDASADRHAERVTAAGGGGDHRRRHT
jgi:hypothetical protein